MWSEKSAFLLDPKTGNWQPAVIKGECDEGEGKRLFKRLGNDVILLDRVIKSGFRKAVILRLQDQQLVPVLFPKHIPSLNASFYWCDIDASGHTYLAYRDTLYQLDASGLEIALTPLDNICTDCYNLCFQFAPDGSLVLLANWRFYVLDKAQNRFVPHRANRFWGFSTFYCLNYDFCDGCD